MVDITYDIQVDAFNKDGTPKLDKAGNPVKQNPEFKNLTNDKYKDAVKTLRNQGVGTGFLGTGRFAKKRIEVTEKLGKDAKKVASYWQSYYGGVDVCAYIGGTIIDDIVTLQYTKVNNKSPLYGYMSEKFDAVSRGTTIIQGEFTIAYTQRNYLFQKLLNYTKELDQNSENNKLLMDKYYIDKSNKNSIKQKVSDYYPVDKYSYVTDNRGGFIDADGFEIIVCYGEFFQGNENIITPHNRSGERDIISGIHITSVSKICQPTGEAIAETYTFFARTLNEDDDFGDSYTHEKHKRISKDDLITREELNDSIENRKLEQDMLRKYSGISPTRTNPDTINALNRERLETIKQSKLRMKTRTPEEEENITDETFKDYAYMTTDSSGNKIYGSWVHDNTLSKIKPDRKEVTNSLKIINDNILEESNGRVDMNSKNFIFKDNNALTGKEYYNKTLKVDTLSITESQGGNLFVLN